MFNMFSYLQIKGFNNEELSKHFEKINEANENINKILKENPRAVLKNIKINYSDEEKTALYFDINIEVGVN